MHEVTLRIDGMHCGSCVRRVTQSLQSISGIEVEEVRLGAARVRLIDSANAGALITALGKAGFSALEEKYR